jgi:hypothetical protein
LVAVKVALDRSLAVRNANRHGSLIRRVDQHAQIREHEPGIPARGMRHALSCKIQIEARYHPRDDVLDPDIPAYPVVALTALSDVIQSNIRPDGIIRSDFLLQKTTVLEG